MKKEVNYSLLEIFTLANKTKYHQFLGFLAKMNKLPTTDENAIKKMKYFKLVIDEQNNINKR